MNLIRIAALSTLVACGVSDSTPVSNLNDGQRQALCEDAAALQPTDDVTCGELTFTPEDFEFSVAGCVDNLAFVGESSCELTVGEWQTCQEAMAADLCWSVDGTVPEGCETFFACP